MGITGEQTHMPAVRHRVDKEELCDEHMNNVTVTYEGCDAFLNHWIRITPNHEECEFIIDKLRSRLSEQYKARVSGYTAFDPLEQFFTNTSVKCRLARAGNFSIHEGERTDDVKQNPVVWLRHETTTQLNIEAEKNAIIEATSSDKGFGESKDEEKNKDGHEYAFDVDISFAGAFICAEGPLASIVCRRLFRYIKSEKVCDTQFEKLDDPDVRDCTDSLAI